MSKRTNTAQWEEKYQRWRIAVQKDGVRKQFYSSTPGRTGQREANAKADRWLDDGIGVKARRVEDLYQEWYATVVKTTGTGNQRNVESRWRTRILPAIGRKRITSLTEQDLQDVVNDAYSDGLAKKSLQSLCADMRAFCKWCRAKKLTTFHPEGLHVPAELSGVRLRQNAQDSGLNEETDHRYDGRGAGKSPRQKCKASCSGQALNYPQAGKP